MSATSSILSKSRTAPITWYCPVRSSARAVLRPRPEDVPVTTTIFLSPKRSLASMLLKMSFGRGIFQLAMNLNALAASASSSTASAARRKDDGIAERVISETSISTVKSPTSSPPRPRVMMGAVN